MECLLSLAGNNPLAHVRRQARDRLAFIRQLLLGVFPVLFVAHIKSKDVERFNINLQNGSSVGNCLVEEFENFIGIQALLSWYNLLFWKTFGIPVGLVRPVGVLQNQSATDCIALCSRSCGGRYAGG